MSISYIACLSLLLCVTSSLFATGEELKSYSLCLTLDSSSIIATGTILATEEKVSELTDEENPEQLRGKLVKLIEEKSSFCDQLGKYDLLPKLLRNGDQLTALCVQRIGYFELNRLATPVYTLPDTCGYSFNLLHPDLLTPISFTTSCVQLDSTLTRGDRYTFVEFMDMYDSSAGDTEVCIKGAELQFRNLTLELIDKFVQIVIYSEDPDLNIGITHDPWLLSNLRFLVALFFPRPCVPWSDSSLLYFDSTKQEMLLQLDDTFDLRVIKAALHFVSEGLEHKVKALDLRQNRLRNLNLKAIPEIVRILGHDPVAIEYTVGKHSLKLDGTFRFSSLNEAVVDQIHPSMLPKIEGTVRDQYEGLDLSPVAQILAASCDDPSRNPEDHAMSPT